MAERGLLFVSLLGWLVLCTAQTGDDNQCKDFDPSLLDGSNPTDYCVYQIAGGKTPKVGTICLAKPQDVHPTQAAYGEVDAGCVQRGLEAYASAKDGSLRAYLQNTPVPTIVGPDGQLYITDHHHLSIALLHAFLPYSVPMVHRVMFLCIGYDFSHQNNTEFWETLQNQNLVWLYGNRGNPITIEQIPRSVKYLEDDPYRTLSLWARQAFAFVKCGSRTTNKLFPQCQGGKVVAKPYIEFKWGNMFRRQFPLIDIYDQSDQAQVTNLESIFPGALLAYAIDPSNKNMEGYNQLGPNSMAKVTPDEHGCVKDLISEHKHVISGKALASANTTAAFLRTSVGDFALTAEQLAYVELRQREVKSFKSQRQGKLTHQQRIG